MTETISLEGETRQLPIPYPGRWIDEVASDPVEGYSSTIAAGKPVLVKVSGRPLAQVDLKAPAVTDIFDELQASISAFNHAMATLSHGFAVPTDPFVGRLALQILFGAKSRYLQPAVKAGLRKQIGYLFEQYQLDSEMMSAPIRAESFSHLLDFLIARRVQACPAIGISLRGEFSAVWFDTAVGKVTAEFKVDGKVRMFYLLSKNKERRIKTIDLGNPRGKPAPLPDGIKI